MAKRSSSRSSWREKLAKVQEAKVGPMPASMAARLGPGMMLIPRGLDLERVIRGTAPGELITPAQIRERLAEEAGADVTCPLVTGIFIRIAAEAAEEDRAAGRGPVTPYWRVVAAGGYLNPKFPGGTAAQAERLQAEGHVVEAGAGKKGPRVQTGK
jgi:hypothetical protein